MRHLRRLGRLCFGAWVLAVVVRRLLELPAARPADAGSVLAPETVVLPPVVAAANPHAPVPVGRSRRVLRASAAGLLFALALSWAGWLLSGGALFTVGSPSMGEVAPVGSLVLTRPLAPTTPLRVGQLVVYRPRGPGSTPYVHRIVHVFPGGRFDTKGDLNPIPDPWTGDRAEIAGVPVAIVPGVGWLYRLSAWLGIGAALLLALDLTLPRQVREWTAALGPAILILPPLLRDRPLTGAFVYGYGQHGREAAARIVNTGVLPVRFSARGGHGVIASPGQERLVRGIAPGRHQPFHLAVVAALPWWGWAAVALVCLLPLAVSLLRGAVGPDNLRFATPAPA